MSPRFLGAKAVIARSFARIHETNLKKQGVLPLVFLDPTDYEKVRVDDRISILGLDHLTPNGEVTCRIDHAGWHQGGDPAQTLRSTTSSSTGSRPVPR